MVYFIHSEIQNIFLFWNKVHISIDWVLIKGWNLVQINCVFCFISASKNASKALVTQPMLQLRPNCTELRSMDSYIQILCRFQKCKLKVPPSVSVVISWQKLCSESDALIIFFQYINFTSFTKLSISMIQHTYMCDKNIHFGAIFILRKDLGVGGWSRKWHFPLTLCSENVLTYVGGWFKKASKQPYVI